jgi:glucose/arabinose dehydrogenase
MLVYFLSFAALISLALAQAPVVPVKPFTPTPIRITLADLPKPFATPSAGKPAIVVPIPADATLLVPDTNFRITVYRDGLRSPRQMIYTPTGEILVTQSSGNIISILTDNDIATFADGSNGISQAFGMAFIEVRLILFFPSQRIASLRRVGSMLLQQVVFVDINIPLVIND